MVANKLLIGVGGTLAAAALTIGAVSATGGGPISSGDDALSEDVEQEASPTPVEEEDEEEVDELEDDEDTNEDESDDLDGEGSDDSAGNQKIAEAIAEEFETTPEEVLALHDEGIGFGAIFKLYLIARAKGITVHELLAQIEEDGGGFAFGKLKKSLTDEELAIFEDGPKNLGELVSGSNHEDGDDSDEAETEDAGESETSRGGPPDHAKSKDHGKKN